MNASSVLLFCQFKRLWRDPNATQVWYVLIRSFDSTYAIKPILE